MAELLSSEATLTTSLQNNCSKQQQTLSTKLESVFEKDITIDVLINKKLRKAKIKASEGKKKFTMPMPMPTSMPMLMPRCRCQDFQMAKTSEIKNGNSRTIYFFFLNLNLCEWKSFYNSGLHRNHKKYLSSMQILKKIIEKGSFG